MLKLEDVKAFCEIPGYRKFENSIYGNGDGFSPILPGPGKKIAVCWFSAAKKEIFQSKDPVCLEIQRQYSEYQEYLKRTKGNVERKKTPFEEALTIFCRIANLDKFAISFVFPMYNYTNTANFFKLNSDYILNSDLEICKEIRKQYIKYRIKYRNQRNEFHKELNLDKFDLDCNLVFPSYPEESMANWFSNYKEYISKIEEPIEKEIMLHYEIYKQERVLDNKKSKIKTKKHHQN